MNRNKSLLLLCVIFSLFFAGCCKKCNKKSNKNVALSSDVFDTQQTTATTEMTALNEDDQELDTELEDFFDDNVSEFTFIDDEELSKENDEELDLFDKDTNQVMASADSDLEEKDIDINFFEDEEDEDAFVAWDEEENLEEDINFKTVQFDINKNTIRKDQKNTIKENIETAKAAVEKGKTIIVQGHCCQLGSPSYNIPLSERRAKIIKKEMVKNGIDGDKIKTIGFGQEMPIVWSDKKDKQEQVKELAPNRRVEVVLG